MKASISERRAAWFLPLAIAAVVLMLYCTRWGSGLGGDSFYYVSGARHLTQGLGFTRPTGDGGTRPITHFPPLYSLALTVPVSADVEVTAAARWLNALLLGSSVLLTGLIALRITGSTWLALAGQAAVMLAPVMLEVHSWVLSEPLFLTILLAFLLSLVHAAQRDRMALYVVCGVLASLAWFTRYVGSAVIAAGLVALLFWPGRPWRSRIRQGLAFAVGCLPVPTLWLLRNWMVSGALTNRALEVHWVTLATLREGLGVMALWLLPASIPSRVRLVLFLLGGLALMVGSAWLIWHQPRPEDEVRVASDATAGVWVLSVFALAYAVLLLLSLSFLDASTALDDRMLSPLYPVGVMLALVVSRGLFDRAGRPHALQATGSIVLVAFVALTAWRGWGTVRALAKDGQGYASRSWHQSTLVAAIRALPDGIPIYSNELDGIYLLTGRPAFMVPIRWDPMRAAPRADFEVQLALMRQRLFGEGGVLVLFPSLARQESFLPSEAELTAGLAVALTSAEGVIYSAPE
ncbi:MAG: hypothetical protein AB1449_01285 [Chloroflexota bacterium]